MQVRAVVEGVDQSGRLRKPGETFEHEGELGSWMERAKKSDDLSTKEPTLDPRRYEPSDPEQPTVSSIQAPSPIGEPMVGLSTVTEADKDAEKARVERATEQNRKAVARRTEELTAAPSERPAIRARSAEKTEEKKK